MRIRDLVSEPDLGLRVVVGDGQPGDTPPIAWCAVTELMDPTPHLSAGAVVLTTGMGLGFSDPRTWSAYVERLRRVHVAGVVFGLGPVHASIPSGLATECEAQGLPLLELPAHVPLLQVSRRVTDVLGQERMRELAGGWELADECTRMVTAGAGLTRVLGRIAAEVGGTVSVVDETGAVLESAAGEDLSPDMTSTRGQTYLRLPADTDGARFRLAVTGMSNGVLAQPRLGPVAAVIGMVLASTLTSVRPMHSDEAALFIGALDTNEPLGGDALAERARTAGFAPEGPWGFVRLTLGDGMGQARLRAVMWRVRTALGARIGHARVHERPGEAAIVVQPRRGDAAASEGWGDGTLYDAVDVLLRAEDDVSAQLITTDTLAELVLASRVRPAGESSPSVMVLPPLDLGAVIAGIPRAGLEALTDRLLSPVERAGPELLPTLEAWLAHSGRVAPVCDALFIHRNTLAHRVRTIERALGLDLSDGDVRATCSLALRIRRKI